MLSMTTNVPSPATLFLLPDSRKTAIEQEKQRRRTTVITLNGTQVVEELVNGRILIRRDRATELAGRCCATLKDRTLDPAAELLAHERGWIWAIYYTQGKERTDFALIHSDGTRWHAPLQMTLSRPTAIVAVDSGGSPVLILFPFPGQTQTACLGSSCAYGQYLANECGYIQLDGLPADSDVGSRRLRLENLFVPLHLDVTIRAAGEQRRIERQPVGVVLADHPRSRCWLPLVAANPPS